MKYKPGKSIAPEVIAQCTSRLIAMGSNFSTVDHHDFKAVLYILKQNLHVYTSSEEEDIRLNRTITIVKDGINAMR